MKRKKAEQIEELRTAYTDFADYLARIVMHPKTPAALKSALQAVIVNAMSNESGYNWSDDEEGLRFLVPRFLEQMNEEYAFGILHTLYGIINDTLPEALRREIRGGSL